MSTRDLDECLRSAGSCEPLSLQLLDRVRRPILGSLTPVRPLPAPELFAAAFFAIAGGIAWGAAMVAGMYGFQALHPVERGWIFGMLVSVAVLAALATARSMRPATRSLSGWVILLTSVVAIEGLFALLFHDFLFGEFVADGFPCLRAGILCAVPAGVLIGVLVRRGWVLSPASTGAAAGSLAGCAGLAMLELHCAILTLPHVAIWHVAVLVVTAAAGALLGRSQWRQNPE